MNGNCRFWYILLGALLGIVVIELTILTVKLWSYSTISERKLDSIITTLDTWELDK